MKVAIAGTGDVAQYLIEEFRNYGHDIVVLTRNAKRGRKYVQRETDYSVASLLTVLEDREALVSTISDFSNPSVSTKVNKSMLEASQQSAICKTFIPSGFTSDVERYPEQPKFLAEANRELLAALEGVGTSVRWTIICTSYFADYVVPPGPQRILRDIGPIWPMHYQDKILTVYGPGDQVVDFTAVRDVAKAMAALLESEEPWEPFTFMSGHQLSFNDLFAILHRRDAAWVRRSKPLADTLRLIAHEEPQNEDNMTGYFELLVYSGASRIPQDRVIEHRSKYFPLVHFRSLEEIFDRAKARPGDVI